MTNITLSIDDEVYKFMKKYSEIKWSEYIRKIIKQRIEDLEKLNKKNNDSIINMLASEEALEEDWNNELDERWNNV